MCYLFTKGLASLSLRLFCAENIPLADQAPAPAQTLLHPPQDGAGPVTAALLGTHESVCSLLCHNILLLINGLAFVPAPIGNSLVLP